MMSTITDSILKELNDDLISHGWLVQAIVMADDGERPSQTRLKDVLSELLATGKVEVGVTNQANPDYVEFVAWTGTIDDRVKRALKAVDAAENDDKLFAYWLCLTKNVDVFETDNNLQRSNVAEQSGERERD